MLKCTGRGLVVKRSGVLSKVQALTLVLGGGGLFPSSNRVFLAPGPGGPDNLFSDFFKLFSESFWEGPF